MNRGQREDDNNTKKSHKNKLTKSTNSNKNSKTNNKAVNIERKIKKKKPFSSSRSANVDKKRRESTEENSDDSSNVEVDADYILRPENGVNLTLSDDDSIVRRYSYFIDLLNSIDFI